MTCYDMCVHAILAFAAVTLFVFFGSMAAGYAVRWLAAKVWADDMKAAHKRRIP
jgi:hypothetical protein